MIGKGALLRAMIHGILARRKLDGDPDVIVTDDVNVLWAIVEQGKRTEDYCREIGHEHLSNSRARRESEARARQDPDNMARNCGNTRKGGPWRRR